MIFFYNDDHDVVYMFPYKSDEGDYKEYSFDTIDILDDFENYFKKPSQYVRNESINFQAIKHSIV